MTQTIEKKPVLVVLCRFSDPGLLDLVDRFEAILFDMGLEVERQNLDLRPDVDPKYLIAIQPPDNIIDPVAASAAQNLAAWGSGLFNMLSQGLKLKQDFQDKAAGKGRVIQLKR